MTSYLKRASVLLVAVAALTAASTAFGQGAPLGGTVTLTLTPSTTAPLPNANFTVDLGINLTAATGTCTGPVVAPATLGSYNLAVTYDNTKLQYVSVASCGVTQFANPVCNDIGTFVNCNDANTGNSTSPQGAVCVARLTFKNLTASAGSPAALATLHSPAPRGVATNLITGTCSAGPATFDAASVTDASVSPITPTSLVRFDAQ